MKNRLRLIVAWLFPLALLAIGSVLLINSNTGCTSPGTNGVATTRPALDPQAIKFLADLAIRDALIVAGNDPKLSKYVDAALKAKATLDNADPAAPEYQKYVTAANDAALDLILQSGKVKQAAATQPSHK